VLRVGHHAISLWSRNFHRQGQETLIFIGFAGLFLAGMGLIEMQARKLFVRMAFLAAPSLAVAVLIGDRLWESRQLLALAPFVATLVAFGLDRITKATDERLLRTCVVALVAMVWLRPQPATLDEGPRVLFGRLYSPWQWSGWQAHEEADVATIDKLIAGARGKTLAVVTDDVNVDRYANQELAKAGFNRALPHDVVADCRQIAEIYSLGERQIVHVRIHQPFVAETELLDRERFETLAIPCLRAIAADETVFLEYGAPFRPNDQGDREAEPPAGFLPRLEASLKAAYRRPITATPLDQAGLQQLDAWYINEEKEQKEIFSRLGRSYRSAQEAILTTRQITPFPK